MDNTRNTVAGNLYGNWSVLGPVGQFMFHTSDKKAQWYLSRHLADKISENIIQLTFQPKGPGCLDRYRRQLSINKCVVCATAQKLTLHHIVPYRYRRYLCSYFPSYARDHHDCLALCLECHRKYEHLASQLSEKIAQDFDIPLEGNMDCSYDVTVSNMSRYVRLSGVLLKWGDRIPSDRKTEILGQLRRIFGDVDIHTLSQMRKENFGYRTHGDLVVERLVQNDRVDHFVQEWRRDFLESMKPKALPRFWQVERPVFKTQEHLDDYR